MVSAPNSYKLKHKDLFILSFLAWCDVSHLSGLQKSNGPIDDKFVVITRKDIYSSDNRIDLLKFKLSNDHRQFMEINELVDTGFNDIKPYVYETPMVPFYDGQPSNDNKEREDIEPTTPKSMVMIPPVLPEKLEDFGYSYDRPLNPMALPDRPFELTTREPYDELPGASARIVGKRAGREYW